MLTPRSILIETPMTGYELDFSNAEVIRATNEAFILDTDHGTGQSDSLVRINQT